MPTSKLLLAAYNNNPNGIVSILKSGNYTNRDLKDIFEYSFRENPYLLDYIVGYGDGKTLANAIILSFHNGDTMATMRVVTNNVRKFLDAHCIKFNIHDIADILDATYPEEDKFVNEILQRIFQTIDFFTREEILQLLDIAQTNHLPLISKYLQQSADNLVKRKLL